MSQYKDVPRTCAQCSKSFLTYSWQLKKINGGKYCSHACRNEYNKSKIECVCQHCKKIFYKTQWEVDRGENKFCTLQCFHLSKIKPLIEANCLNCNCTFFAKDKDVKRGGGKYCSKKCLHEHKKSKLPVKMKRPKIVAKETKELEFLSSVIMPADPNECWIFKKLDGRGYGVMYWKGKAIKAHRFSYEYYVGPIPEGMMICHICDHPACVRWDHLYTGTAKDNAQDREDRNRGRDCKGSKSHNAKINEEQASQIKLKLQQGISCLHIAKEFNVGEHIIRHIKSGETWKHVTINND